MKNKNIIFIMLFIIYGIGYFIAYGQNFEDLSNNLDSEGEFTFSLFSGDSKNISIYGQEFKLILDSVKLYDGYGSSMSNNWSNRHIGEPSLTLRFYYEKSNSKVTVGHTQIYLESSSGGSYGGTGYISKYSIENNYIGSEETMFYPYPFNEDGVVVIYGEQPGSDLRVEFPKGKQILGSLKIQILDKNISKLILLIIKDVDLNNRSATFLIKEIKENLITSKSDISPTIILNMSKSQNIEYNLYWEKKLAAEIFSVDLSADGSVIGTISGTKSFSGGTSTTSLFNKKGDIIWSTSYPPYKKLALSQDGKCLVLPLSYTIYMYPTSINKPLWIEKGKKPAGEMYWSADVSYNCDFVSVMNSADGIIYKLNKQGEELWSYKTDYKNIQPGQISMSSNGNYIAILSCHIPTRVSGSCYGYLYLIDKNGKLLWNNSDSRFSGISISPNGNYIAAIGQNINSSSNVFENIISLFSIDGNVIKNYQFSKSESGNYDQKYIQKVSVIDSGLITLYDSNYQKSSAYLIDKEGNLIWRKDFDNLITALSTSIDGSNIIVGNNNGSLLYFSKSSSEKESYFNMVSLAIGVLAIGFISIFIALPYHKRAKLKKQMAKTPTDWCPHCKKFTGGAAICPHCGKEMLVDTKYDIAKKAKKK